MAFDESVRPCDDFYHHINGVWKQTHPIPTGYSHWDMFSIVSMETQDKVLKIIQNSSGDAESIQIRDYWLAAMDEKKIETLGISPVKKLLDLVDTKDVTTCLAFMMSHRCSSPLILYDAPDSHDSKSTIAQLAQGGLGLPDCSYYTDGNKEKIRRAYQSLIADTFTAMEKQYNYPNKSPSQDIAQAVYDLEVKIAKLHMNKIDRIDPCLTYNKMNIRDLQSAIGTIAKDKKRTVDFSQLLKLFGTNEATIGDINVCHLDAVQHITCLLETAEIQVLANYFKWHIMLSFMEFDLPARFTKLYFDFYETVLNGTTTPKPRQRLAMHNIEFVLGDAIGKKFVKAHFPEESKLSVLAIVHGVKNALLYRLTKLEWMSEKTKTHALEKLNNINIKIGYPDQYIDYTSLKIDPAQHFENQLSSNSFMFANMLQKINSTTNRNTWYITPQTVNAYYNPSLNEIVLPAAILTPPFFYHNGDPAMNYGALGAIVGHELTHGFDNTGRKYDYMGNVVDWWTQDDLLNYQSRISIMVRNAQATKVLDTHIDGQLTCGENIADLGGLQLAFTALENITGENIDNFDSSRYTVRQRFFISWAKAWAQNNKKEHQLQSLTTDPHAPAVFRVNSPLTNMKEFREAFDLKESDKMYKSDENMVNLW